MAHKAAYEALDKTLRDVRNNNKVMGGVVFVMAGDFRQILPVVPRGTRADEMKACVKSSYLWPHFSKLYLSTNMRAHLNADQMSNMFADDLLRLGNGNVRPTGPEMDESP